MASFNKVILMGNLTRDPELRYTPSGAPVCNFDLAMNRSYTTQGGEKRDEVCYMTVVVWGKQAEIARDYLSKGKQVYIEGSLQTRQWEDKDGQKRYTTEVKCQRFLMLGGRSEAGAAGGGPEPEMPEDPAFGDEDIPF